MAPGDCGGEPRKQFLKRAIQLELECDLGIEVPPQCTSRDGKAWGENADQQAGHSLQRTRIFHCGFKALKRLFHPASPFGVERRPREDGCVFDGKGRGAGLPAGQIHARFNLEYRFEESREITRREAGEPVELAADDPAFGREQQIPLTSCWLRAGTNVRGSRVISSLSAGGMGSTTNSLTLKPRVSRGRGGPRNTRTVERQSSEAQPRVRRSQFGAHRWDCCASSRSCRKLFASAKFVLPGFAKLGVLVRLNVSARVSTRYFSLMGNCLKNDKSSLWYDGPVTGVKYPPRGQ